MTNQQWAYEAVRLLLARVKALDNTFPSDGLIITIVVSGDAMECDIRAAGGD